MNVCFLSHVEHESGGRFERAARARGWPVTTVQATDPAGLAVAADADLLVVLGGPMGVYEADRYSFLGDELRILTDRLQAERKTIGVCLGAQLLAAAAGGRVFKGKAGFEVGFGELTRSPGAEQHAWGNALPPSFPVLHWHGDTFTLPVAATLLASSTRYPHQIFANGRHSLGLQCHIEVAAGDLPEFIGGNMDDLRLEHGLTRDKILIRAAEVEVQVDTVFQSLWERFLTA